MQLPFLTLPEYAGKSLKPGARRGAVGGGHGQAWQESADERNDQIVFDKVRGTLRTVGETVTGVALLTSDPNGFANTLYRIDAETASGQPKSYFLKILGRREGNRREVFVWRALGYRENGKREAKDWFPGLPPRVYSWPQLNAVLTPYYSGQLPPVRGGSYEFPLVLTVVLRIHETLQTFHQHGLMYMDLWPGNILYVERAVDEPISVFLTDMGSVKMIAGQGGDDEDWRALADAVTADRRTRQDTKPPEWLFEAGETTKTEPHIGYDFHTLARTALILAGFGPLETIEPTMADPFDESLNLEDPAAPTRKEMQTFLTLLADPLQGRAVDTDRLYQLLKDFFIRRAQFYRDYIDDPDLRRQWCRFLQGRVKRYKMALVEDDKTSFPKQLHVLMDEMGPGGCAAELAHVLNLPEHIRAGRHQEVIDIFNALRESTLLKTSQTARYSLSYHRKVLKSIAGGHPVISAWLQETAQLKITTRLEQRPEKRTLAMLRRNPKGNLGLLQRIFGFTEDTK